MSVAPPLVFMKYNTARREILWNAFSKLEYITSWSSRTAEIASSAPSSKFDDVCKNCSTSAKGAHKRTIQKRLGPIRKQRTKVHSAVHSEAHNYVIPKLRCIHSATS